MEITKLKARTALHALSNTAFKDGKNNWASSRNIAKLQPIVDKIKAQYEESRLDNVSVDDKGNKLTETINVGKPNEQIVYKFTPAKEKLLNAAVDKINSETVTIEPYKFLPNVEIIEMVNVFIANDIEFLLDSEVLAQAEAKTFAKETEAEPVILQPV